MQQKEIEAFIQWLPQNIEEFKDKTPEQCAEMLNEMSKTEEGMNTVQQLIAQFQNKAGMFKEGGKLGYLVNKFQDGGKTKKKAVNPNDATSISKALNNRAGDRKNGDGEYIPDDIYTTTRLAADSLKKIGYNKALVDKLSKPILDKAIEASKYSLAVPESETERQFNLLKFLHPDIFYWMNGSKIK